VQENPEIEGMYFPKTFILPEQYEDYKSSHKVYSFKVKNRQEKFTSAKLMQEAKAMALKF